MSWGRALGPLGGLSTGQLNCCLLRMEEKRKEKKGSPIILVFQYSTSLRNSNKVTAYGGHWIQVGYINFAIFYQYLAIFWKWYKAGHSYYETVIGTHMRSIEPWHFRWPWVNAESHFGDLLTLVTLCAQLTRDLSAIAKFFVETRFYHWYLPLYCIPIMVNMEDGDHAPKKIANNRSCCLCVIIVFILYIPSLIPHSGFNT